VVIVANVIVVAVLDNISLHRTAPLYQAIACQINLHLCSSITRFLVLSTNTVADCENENAILPEALGHNISNDAAVSIAKTALAPL